MRDKRKAKEPRLVAKTLPEIVGLSADKMKVTATVDMFYEDDEGNPDKTEPAFLKGRSYRAVDISPVGMLVKADETGYEHHVGGKWMSNFTAQV